jgi:bacterioferritin-associated ferredoxin
MNPDDEVCLCFHVSLRKVRNFLQRENPPVASLISECLGAGTGCQWCVPFLRHLHAQHAKNELVDLRVSPQQYIAARSDFHKTGQRDPSIVKETGETGGAGEVGGAGAGGTAGADAPHTP